MQMLRSRIIAPHRVLALTDGVYAIVMTILVLELSVPIVIGTAINKELSHGLLEMWPEFLIYGLSFLILGIFWLMHHFVFDNIKQYDASLSWINIFFLMCTALIPFSTSLFGAYGAERITAIVYGTNMFLGFLGLTALWLYASTGYRLIDKDLDRNVLKGGTLMGGVYMVATLVAIGISFINPVISFILYFLIGLAIIIFTSIGKSELVIVVPLTDKKER